MHVKHVTKSEDQLKVNNISTNDD